MPTMPAAEYTPDTTLVRALLRSQVPELAELPLTPLAHGWDNVSMRVGDRHLVRCPRRQVAAQLIANEQRWLPRIAPGLPLPIPAPTHVGRPEHGYPWPWSVVPYFDGVNAAQTTALDAPRTALMLAGFLAALHVEAPREAPASAVRGVNLARRDEAFRANIVHVEADFDIRPALATWDHALAAEPWRRAGVWLHGDLHPANILMRDGAIAAILDFGDITRGDPATDLAAAWMLLPARQHEAFWSAYAGGAQHSVDDDLRTRSRGWALMFASVLLARSSDNPVMERIGYRTMKAVLDDAAGDGRAACGC